MRGIRVFYAFGILSLLAGCAVSHDRREPDAVRIVQFCDPQLGMGEDGFEADLARLHQAIRQANALHPDLVVVAGDMVNTPDDASIAAFQSAMKELKVPVLYAPGNHDLPDPVTPEGLARYRAAFGPDYAAVNCGPVKVISADSQLWRVAPAAEVEAHDRWLENELAEAAASGRPVVMLTHVPPFVQSPDEPDEYFNLPLARRVALLRLCTDSGAVVWLAGHTHTTLNRTWDQRLTILNGENTSRNFDGHEPGFRLLTLCPDGTWDWEYIRLEN